MTLNKSILRLVVGAVLFTTLGILISMWVTTSSHTQKRLDRNLNVAHGILQQVLVNREQQLLKEATAISDDFHRDSSLKLNKQESINMLLQQHGNHINADLVAFISSKSSWVHNHTNPESNGSLFPYPELVKHAIEHGSGMALLTFDDKLFQVIAHALNPLEVMLLGFELEYELLTELKDIAQLEISINVKQDDKVTFSLDTLPTDKVSKIMNQLNTEFNWFESIVLRKHRYISKQFPLSDMGEHNVSVVLSENSGIIFSEFSDLQLTISIVAILSMIITLIFGAFVSRKISRPLNKLARIAERISHGDYRQKLDPNNKPFTELKDLSNAFSVMQENIQVREAKIIYQARHDLLTGVNNRYSIEQLIDEKFALSEPFDAIGINIFDFRGINDLFGHSNGDFCLKELAERVAKLGGVTARLTGGELLWLPDTQNTPDELNLIKQQLENPIEAGDVVITPKIVIGVIHCPKDADTTQLLFKRLNIIIDEAQNTQELMRHYLPAFEERYLRRLSIVTELKQALATDHNQFSLVYQPKLSIAANQIQSAEALIRWNNPNLGFVSPEDFISLAEQAGFIDKITRWVIDNVINHALVMKQAGQEICIAINLSAHDVINQELLPYIAQAIEQKGLPKEYLSFEVTESDVVSDPVKAVKYLSAFRDFGFALAIDDFGTGYSSMAYLKSLPVTSLKIDKSFVLNLDNQADDQNIVQTILQLAKVFDMNVIAEGIENKETLGLLKQWGCEYAQGYYIAKPMPLDSFIEWLERNKNKEWLNSE